MTGVLVVHGPNLNLLGTREPDVYGTTTLRQLEEHIADWARPLGLECRFFQSNHEGALIDALHEHRADVAAVLINAGALTHYSYALHDALVAIEKLAVEVHISNVHAREEWRRASVLAPATDHVIFGRGLRGYQDGLRRIAASLAHPPQRVAYGPSNAQYGELRVPAGAGPHPVAVLIHGGFWRQQWTLDLMDPIALDLVGRGWAAWNIEYHRVGGGGGWPTTLEDVAAAFDELRELAATANLDLENVVAIGHSAGGQLALWSAARPRLYAEQPADPAPLKPSRVVALAPVTDLAAAHSMDLSDGAVDAFLRRPPDRGDGRYAAASPIELLPSDVPQLIVHGVADDDVPPSQSATYAAAAGDGVELILVDEADHFDLITPTTAAWARVVDWLD